MKHTRRLLTAAFAGVLLLSACGSDDDSSATTEAPATEATEAPQATEPDPEPATTEEMADDEMAEDEMSDDDGAGVLVDELTTAGLTGDQAQCVVDAAVAEWGAEAILAAGSATDEQLVRLAEITFDCAT